MMTPGAYQGVVIGLAIPEAFHDLPGDLSGPAVITGAYFTLRAGVGACALGQLAVLAALLTGLIVFESVRFARERDELRHGEQHA